MICYRCGQPIIEPGPRIRRKVRTGEWVRRRSKDNKAEQIQFHFGRRVVCRKCAVAIDWEFRRQELLQYGEFILAVVVLLAVILYRLFS